MRSIAEIRSLLDCLNQQPAHELEDQDLDFKEWNPRSMADSINLVIENDSFMNYLRMNLHDKRFRPAFAEAASRRQV